MISFEKLNNLSNSWSNAKIKQLFKNYEAKHPQKS